MVTRTPRLELLWWEGCPSTDAALALLREEAAKLGLDPAAIEVREVPTDASADRERFIGSPTIRVDGADVQPPGGEPVGLTWRVYRLRDGHVSHVPARADIRAAIQTALEGGDGDG